MNESVEVNKDVEFLAFCWNILLVHSFHIDHVTTKTEKFHSNLVALFAWIFLQLVQISKRFSHKGSIRRSCMMLAQIEDAKWYLINKWSLIYIPTGREHILKPNCLLLYEEVSLWYVINLKQLANKKINLERHW